MARFLFCSLGTTVIGDVAWQGNRESHDVTYDSETESDSSSRCLEGHTGITAA